MEIEHAELKEYLYHLNHTEDEIRVNGYREIGDLNIPEGNQLLIDGLSDKSPWVRSVVADILVNIAEDEIIDNLLELLRLEDPGLRSRAMEILASIGESALEQIESFLSDKDVDIRIFAANILGNMGFESSFQVLARALDDSQDNVRYAAVEALGKIGAQESIPLLIDILSDEWARYPAIESLGLLKAKTAISKLLDIYVNDEWVRHAVIEAIGNIGDPDQIDFLIKAIQTDNEMIQNTALSALVKIEQTTPGGALKKLVDKGIDIETILPAALKVHEPEIRKPAIWTLGCIGSAHHVQLIIPHLADFDEEIKEITRKALISLGKRFITDLIKAYDDQTESIQLQLIDVFAHINDEQCIELIIDALKNGDAQISKAAAQALGSFQTKMAIDTLITFLKDPIGNVRGACANSLGRLKSVKATRFLILLMEDEFGDVREAASEALGKIGTNEVITHVAPMLKHPRADVRQAAIQCLGLIMNRSVNGYLIKALNNSERSVRRFAAGSIEKRKLSQALGPLMTTMLDKDWQVRKTAADALGSIGDNRCVKVLVETLCDGNIWVRYAAVTALGKIGDQQAQDPLHNCLKQDTAPVQIAAMEALHVMKDPDLIQLLSPLSKKPDEEIRKAVAETLSHYNHDEAAINILNDLKQDHHPKVKAAAEKSMAKKFESKIQKLNSGIE